MHSLRDFIFVLAMGAVFGMGAVSCGRSPISSQPRSSPKSAVSALPQPAQEPLQRGEVIFAAEGRTPWRVAVEVARTSSQRAKGLMNRKSLGDDEGMLFIFEHLKQHQFYMKNTYIPLDIVFLSGVQGEVVVVGILHNMRPFDEASKFVDAPSLSAVEVRAPLASKHGVKIGDRVILNARAPAEPTVEQRL